MTKEDLQKKIFDLLSQSKISDHQKRMITLLLPAMQEQELTNIYNALFEEVNKLKSLGEKKKRLELKYKIMTDKLSEFKKS